MSAAQSETSKQQHDEGGWGLIVLVAAFSAECIIFGNIKALGVLADTISKEFDTDLWLTGWIVSMSLAVQFMSAPLVFLLLGRFSYRSVLLLGGVMTTTGYVLASFSRNFIEWSICMVGLAGIGSSCFVYPLISLLATYFKRYYPVCVLIADLGMSFGTLLYGPLTQVLLDTYGWRWALMLLGGLTFHLVPAAAVAKASHLDSNKQKYQSITQTEEDSSVTRRPPLHDPETRENKHWCSKILAVIDLAILKDVHFILQTSTSCVVAFCFVGWAVYVVPHGIKQGLSPVQASFLPTSFGVGNIVGKLTATALLQKKVFGERWIMCMGALFTSICFIVDPFLNSFPSLLLVTMAIGTGNGICSTTKIILYRGITTDDRLLSIYSWSALFVGVSDVLSGFASGWLFDVTGSFIATFIMFGVVHFLAVIFMLIDIAVAYKEAHDS